MGTATAGCSCGWSFESDDADSMLTALSEHEATHGENIDMTGADNDDSR